MNRATFFNHFELLADQQDAVAKMRELVLELAVRGKLIPQNPTDEPAEAKFGRNEELNANAPFEIPEKWTWAQLSQLADINGGFAFKSTDYTDEGTRVIRISDFDEFGFKDHKIVRHPFSPDVQKFMLAENNILMAMTGGTVGKSYFVKSLPEPMVVNQRVATIKVSATANPSYVDIAIRSEMTQEVIRKAKNSTNDNISMGDIKRFTIPLPPLAEQRQIVVKVDELMALCDELEQQQQARQHASGLLQQSALHHLLAAREPQSFFTAWQRVRDHFHLLHDTPDAIPQLRQAILQLAVQGRLVPQNPKDEPAFQLVERIAANHADSVRKGASKLGRQFATLKNEDAPFQIPSTWAWAKLGHLRDAKSPITYGVLVPGPEVDDGIPFVRLQDLSVTNPAAKPNKSISPEIEAAYSRTRLRGGEILLGVVGSIGKIGVAPPSWAGANIARAVSRIIPDANLLRDYLVLVLQSAYFQNYLRETTRTLAQPTLNIGQLEVAPVPVPPLAEQKRIVARVEELLRWCDTLEAQLHQTRTLGAHLLASTLHHLLAA